MLKIFFKFLKILNSNISIPVVAFSLTLGFLMAQYPTGNIQWIVLLILVIFVMRINLKSFITFFLLFSIIPPFLHSLSDKIGTIILTNDAYQQMWTDLYNSPIWYLTRFNNTVIMGFSTIFIPLGIISFILMFFLVKLYRNKLKDKIADNKIYKAFIKIPLVMKITKLAAKFNV